MKPALSIGNVGQLAVDLMVSSTGAERIGYLDDPHVLPCVGNDAYGPLPQGELALPLEGIFALLLIVHFLLLRKKWKCNGLWNITCEHGLCNLFHSGFSAYDSLPNGLTLLQQRSPVVKVKTLASLALFLFVHCLFIYLFSLCFCRISLMQQYRRSMMMLGVEWGI